MLKSGNQIRLTDPERKVYDIYGGPGLPAPKTVAEHDARLERAATAWEAGESAEEQLLAALARDKKIGQE